MKRKTAVSALAILLAVLMVLSLIVSAIPVAFAIDQSDINALRQRKEEISARVAEAQERIDGLRVEESGVLELKAALDEQNNSAKEQLDLTIREIEMYDEIIDEKNEELQDAISREEVQLSRYRNRVRAMEESGGYNILALIVTATNFSELLTGLDDMGEIMESDKALESKYRAAREETERVKAEFEEIRDVCEEHKEELRQEQAVIELKINEAQAELASLADQIEIAVQQHAAELAAEQQAVNDLTQLIAAYEEQKRQEALAAAAAAAAAGGGGGGGGGGLGGGNASGTANFSWPVPSSSRVTSRYGTRTDPFTGQTSTHSGIDIDGFGNDGQAILSSAGGTVVTAGSNGGYGNYVVIDHGNGYQTVYAHMSGIAVSAGQSVSGSETIGYLGSTGRSTGTHCHFEVRLNGSTIDPEQFFSGLSYWNC